MARRKGRVDELSSRGMLLLGTVSGLAIGAVLSQRAIAQDTGDPPPPSAETAGEDETTPDTIIVRGFRSSLENAQNIKENADTFLDAITAEDIGALPDRSVAEALQRIPGVNISRFAEPDDPDRFSVEGTGVVIRGLPFVRSELNGRDIFSANGGRVLSFNDVSPELLGSVEVFKNATADMIDGGISGTVNLVTRKPLDNEGLNFAGTVEGNYGDLAEEWSPAFSFLGSNTFETDLGTFGVQLGYAYSELQSRADVSQVTDPCYRADTLDSGCFRIQSVGSGGFFGDQNFTPDTFPPAGSVLVPKGAGVRTTDFERERQAISAIGQWESPDRSIVATLEYLRSDADQFLSEFAILALVNDDNLFPIPAAGTTWNFDENGLFQSGILSQVAGRGADDCLPGSLNPPDGLERPCNPQIGIPTETLRFQRGDEASTDDISFDLKWNATDRLRLNFEAQRITSDRDEDGFIAAMQTVSDIFLDLGPETPTVQFLTPATTDGSTDPNYFQNPDRTYYWFLIDNQVRNSGELTSFRGDADYDFDDGQSFLRSVRFGARWAQRERETRNANFSNWGNLSAPWAGAAVYASNPTGNVANSAQVRSPFADFQRGEAPAPVADGAATFFGPDDLVANYLSGGAEEQAAEIINTWVSLGGFFGTNWQPLTQRAGLVEGTPFRPGEISDVEEETLAFYGRADFGSDNLFNTGLTLEANAGLRYVETTVTSGGELQFPIFGAFDLGGGETIQLDADNYFAIICDPANVTGPGQQLSPECDLSEARRAEFLAAFTGESIDDSADIEYEHWLPSFNAKLGVTDDVFVRFAVSKGISRPDLALYRTGGTINNNTGNLRQGGTQETGALFNIFTGNRLLEPVESWNYDLSAEWYFADVGSLTFSLFAKDIEGIVNFGPTIREITSPGGASAVVEVLGPANSGDGTLTGFELAYQQTYDFLPAPFDGLGTQFTYTYVDADDFENSDLNQNLGDLAEVLSLPLVGVSENTFNAVVFYENDKISTRLAYNWRDEFLLTQRDVIFPFSPIVAEATGQLDGSFFYSVTDNWKLGVQGVNLLDEIAETSQIVDFDGTQVSRSAFRSDRRFTFTARFDF